MTYFVQAEGTARSSDHHRIPLLAQRGPAPASGDDLCTCSFFDAAPRSRYERTHGPDQLTLALCREPRARARADGPDSLASEAIRPGDWHPKPSDGGARSSAERAQRSDIGWSNSTPLTRGLPLASIRSYASQHLALSLPKGSVIMPRLPMTCTSASAPCAAASCLICSSVTFPRSSMTTITEQASICGMPSQPAPAGCWPACSARISGHVPRPAAARWRAPRAGRRPLAAGGQLGARPALDPVQQQRPRRRSAARRRSGPAAQELVLDGRVLWRVAAYQASDEPRGPVGGEHGGGGEREEAFAEGSEVPRPAERFPEPSPKTQQKLLRRREGF
ncbi:unnamed protein product [Prorocentrum cordatum]|uniref:Uncharacterized protein n=1 Tax=Prorocentrum cordatum TaxID=2364126 RepID=A0ABN9QTS1_9DINO|nr:unnamed protein product [Polarella glacialis]